MFNRESESDDQGRRKTGVQRGGLQDIQVEVITTGAEGCYLDLRSVVDGPNSTSQV